MRVMRLRAGENLLAGMQLPGNPKRFEIREGAAPAQMTEVVVPAKHSGDFGDGFFLHGGCSAAAVKSVVVGIDIHRQGVRDARDRMRRVGDLAGVERVKVGIVVAQTKGNFVQNTVELGVAHREGLVSGQRFESSIEGARSFDQFFKRFSVEHANSDGPAKSASPDESAALLLY